MAFSTMIRTLEADRAKLLIDQIELPIGMADPRFRKFFNGAYLDYYGVFSYEEVKTMNEKAIAEDRGFPGWLEKNIELQKFMEDASNKGCCDVLLIHIYEWESGLD